MPVPDRFDIAPDFQLCEICDKCKPDNEFRHVAIQQGEKLTAGMARAYVICEDCYQKCKTDSDFEKYVTDFVFEHKLGRLMRIKRDVCL